MTILLDASGDRFTTSIDDNATFAAKLSDAMNYYPPAPRDQRVAKKLMSAKRVSGHIPMSNVHVRETVEEGVRIAVLNDFKNNPAQLGRRHFLLTATPDDCNTYNDAPVLTLARLQRKVRRTLIALGLNGWCAFEFDTLAKKLPGDNARLILGHAHGVVWTYDADFQARKVSRLISKTRAYQNRIGIPGFDLTSRAESCARRRQPMDLPDLDQTEDSMRYMVHYIMKRRACSKNRWIDENGHVHTDYDFDHFSYGDAIRMAEIQSYLTPQSCIFGVGDGEDVVREYRKSIRRALAPSTRDADWLHEDAVSDFWRRYASNINSPGWRPAAIL